MAIYEDIHEIDEVDERIDDDSVDRWRQHRDAPPRPHTTPILIGALVVVIAGVFAIDALRMTLHLSRSFRVHLRERKLWSRVR